MSLEELISKIEQDLEGGVSDPVWLLEAALPYLEELKQRRSEVTS